MFQEIRNTLGQKEQNSDYQLKTTVSALIKKVKKLEYNPKTGNPGQSLLIFAGGEEEWIKLIGKFDELDSSYENRTFDFRIWPFQPDGSPKAYLYAWIQRQSGTQTSPQPRQATNVPNMTQQDALAILDRLRAYIGSIREPLPYTAPPPQQYQPNPEYEENPQPPDDDIPF
jgi:hypothetical protein